jgi:hypothetical protein
MGKIASWQAVGRQRYEVADDLLHLEILADITLPEIRLIFDELLRLQASHGYALFLITFKGSQAFPAEVRRFLSQFHRQHKTAGATAVVGANRATALFADLVLHAVGLVSGHRPQTRFFSTHADALVWLEEKRTLGRQGLLTH